MKAFELIRLAAALGRRDHHAVYRSAGRLVERDPTDTLALNASARAAAELGRTEEAVATWEAVVAIDPESFEALKALATHAAERDRQDDAREYLRRAVAAFPEGPSLPSRPMILLMNVIGTITGRGGLGSRARDRSEARWREQRRWRAQAAEYLVNPARAGDRASRRRG